jgi:hypothetical protein
MEFYLYPLGSPVNIVGRWGRGFVSAVYINRLSIFVSKLVGNRKVNLNLCFSHHTMKAYGDVQVQVRTDS